METSLATDSDDSFSFRWLPLNPLPSTDFPAQSPHKNDDHLKTTTTTTTTTNNFTFDVSVSTTDHHSTPLSIFMSPLTHHHVSTPNQVPPKHQKSVFMAELSRLSRKVLHKYLCFLFPCCPPRVAGKTRRRRRRGKRVDDLNRRAKEVKCLSNTTPETLLSPRMSTAWSDYAETSIYEAILYCKRSCGQ